ncbi:MAG TPA: AbgT family transporter, partial [Wenzhouxiangella sp.]|nr:AbgT family transporter [Wenzhouxiangella sp.]
MNSTEQQPAGSAGSERGWLNRALNFIEVVGNKLPDPAMLFLLLMIVVWILSWLMSGIQFGAQHPSTGEAITITNLLTGEQLVSFLTTMVDTF